MKLEIGKLYKGSVTCNKYFIVDIINGKTFGLHISIYLYHMAAVELNTDESYLHIWAEVE